MICHIVCPSGPVYPFQKDIFVFLFSFSEEYCFLMSHAQTAKAQQAKKSIGVMDFLIHKIIDLYLEAITVFNAEFLISEGITKSN